MKNEKGPAVDKKLPTSKISLRLLISFFLITYFPEFIYVMFDVSSLALGLVVSAGLVCVINIKKSFFFTVKNNSAIIFCASILIITIYAAANYLRVGDSKALTILALPFLFLSAYCVGKRMSETSIYQVISSVRLFIILTFIVGWLGFFDITNFGPYSTNRAKAIFPFSEESFYGLCLGLFCVAYSVVCSARNLFFIFINITALAFSFPSLTLLVFCCLILVIGIARWRPVLLMPLMIVGLVFITLVSASNLSGLEYFTERLSFEESDNLTTLAWLQGWELARANFMHNMGTGLGLQMLGARETIFPDSTYLIETIVGSNQNIQDGGFLLAKVIAELGVIGCILALYYFFQLMKFYLFISRPQHAARFSAKRRRELDVLFFGGFIPALFVEVFLRGIGYFSPTLYLFFVFMIARHLVKKRNHQQKVLYKKTED